MTIFKNIMILYYKELVKLMLFEVANIILKLESFLIIIKRGVLAKKDSKIDKSAAELFTFLLIVFLVTLFLKEGYIF